MPKTNVDKIKATMKALEKEYGVGSVFTIDSKKSVMKIKRWSTGIEDLDNILGGGIPEGRIIEIFGPESAGKTTLAYHLMGQCRYAVDIPVEGTFDAKRAKVFGNRKGQLIVRRAEYGEQCLETLIAFAEAGVDLVVIDSVPHMITRKEFEQVDMEKEEQRGRIAAMLSRKLPKIVQLCENTGTTVIFVNQLRDEMGGMMFGPQTHTPGGRALKHACSIRIQVNRMKWIKVPNKDPRNSAVDEVVGCVVKVKVAKSKVCNPLGECVLNLFFDRGFVAADDVKSIRQEIMAANNEKLKEIKAALKKANEYDKEDDD